MRVDLDLQQILSMVGELGFEIIEPNPENFNLFLFKNS
jgi:hypothetical protein